MLTTFSRTIITVNRCSNDLTTFPDDVKRPAFSDAYERKAVSLTFSGHWGCFKKKHIDREMSSEKHKDIQIFFAAILRNFS